MPDSQNGRKQGGPDPQWQFFDLQDFGGINTRSPRQSIEDNEFSWLENFFPIAKGNLRTLYGKGAAAYTATGGRTIVYHFFYVLLGVPYAFVCLDNGTAVQINIATQATTVISAVPNTFYNGANNPACVQWGRKYLQIVNNTTFSDYFIWDGTSLYQGGSLGPQVVITNGGSGYTSAPAVTFFGGSGTGATGTATVVNGAVTAVQITNPGSGYAVTDNTIQVIFTGGGSTSKIARLTAVLTAGAVSSITINDGGAGYLSPPTITFIGGGGSGASATAVLTAGAITSFTSLVGGTNYTSPPAVVASGGGNTAATGTVSLMPIGVSGTTIENYSGHTWIGNNDTNTFSAPNDPANFATSAGGGSYSSNDGFLKNRFVRFIQSNSYLYTIADSSINSFNNVTTSGSPSTTTFNNTNADAQVGTPWRDSAQIYGSTFSLGNSAGFYLVYGGVPQKISENLDGMFATATLPSTGNGVPSAVGTIFGIKVLMFLLTVLDPFTNMLTPKLICFEAERKKWFVASQEVTLTYISTQEVNSVLTAWGTDGTSLFPMFQTPSITLVKKGLTKYWNGESYLWKKQFLRVYSQAIDQSSKGATITYAVDTEQGTSAAVTLSGGGTLIFVNNANQVLQFRNNTPANLTFTSSGNAIRMQNIDSSYGDLMGLRFTSTSQDFVLAAMGIAYQNYSFLQ